MKRFHVVVCCLILLIVGSTDAFAQDTEREKIRQMEEQKQNQKTKSIRAELDSAIVLTNINRYAEADEKYRYVLKNLKSIPSDLTYYFGKNSYLLGKFSQSVDWLNKYIQLKGTSGQYYEEAIEWLHKAEKEVVQEHSQQSAEATTVLSSRNYDIDCGPSGKITCPVCGGSTVVIKKTYLGDQYKTCSYCKKLGYLSCEDYNKVLRGEFKPNQ
ncbi:MAG: hypothetical protein WDO14_14780 [Bacteroidota bacterium]